MRSLQIAFSFYHRDGVITEEDTKKLLSALRQIVGGVIAMQNLDGEGYSILVKTQLPISMTINVIENQLTIALGDNYYYAMVLGELDEFPVRYTTYLSYKFDHEKSDRIFESLNLKLAAANQADTRTNIDTYKNWKNSTNQPEYDECNLNGKLGSGPWRYVRPFVNYKYEQRIRVSYLNLSL